MIEKAGEVAATAEGVLVGDELMALIDSYGGARALLRSVVYRRDGTERRVELQVGTIMHTRTVHAMPEGLPPIRALQVEDSVHTIDREQTVEGLTNWLLPEMAQAVDSGFGVTTVTWANPIVPERAYELSLYPRE